MNDDFHSSVLSQWLKMKIRSHEYYHYKLRLLANCMTYGDLRHGVQVISNGTDTRILGPRACQNSWACPECTARQMKKYSTRIAAALDALKDQGYAAAMFTFTIFHTIRQSCEDTFFLLRKAWEIMDKQKTWRRKKKDGSYYVNAGIWSQFHNAFQFTHHVKTLEVTYGKHGWHPHIHMLIWFKKSDLQKLADWEEKLNTEWSRCIDKAAKLLYGTESERYKIRQFLESKADRDDAEHLGLYISKTEDGKIREWTSGAYLCGWGGENELTGLNLKSARKDNMTPFQMLDKAWKIQNSDPIQSNRLVELYLNFAWTVIKNRIARVAFSRTGLNAIVKQHIQTKGFKEILKKKKESAKIAAYRNIAWFNMSQWYAICSCENIYIIPLIKRFATYENAFELICELCIVNNLSPPLLKQHPVIDFATAFNEMLEIA